MSLTAIAFLVLVFTAGYSFGMFWALWKDRDLPKVGEHVAKVEAALMAFSTRIDGDGVPCWCVYRESQWPHEGWVHAPRCSMAREALELT